MPTIEEIADLADELRATGAALMQAAGMIEDTYYEDAMVTVDFALGELDLTEAVNLLARAAKEEDE